MALNFTNTESAEGGTLMLSLHAPVGKIKKENGEYASDFKKEPTECRLKYV